MMKLMVTKIEKIGEAKTKKRSTTQENDQVQENWRTVKRSDIPYFVSNYCPWTLGRLGTWPQLSVGCSISVWLLLAGVEYVKG